MITFSKIRSLVLKDRSPLLAAGLGALIACTSLVVACGDDDDIAVTAGSGGSGGAGGKASAGKGGSGEGGTGGATGAGKGGSSAGGSGGAGGKASAGKGGSSSGGSGGVGGSANAGKGGSGGSAGSASDCFQNPTTHVELINGCTADDVEVIDTFPSTPNLQPDGGLPPLP
jgi:hypothetical protein